MFSVNIFDSPKHVSWRLTCAYVALNFAKIAELEVVYHTKIKQDDFKAILKSLFQ